MAYFRGDVYIFDDDDCFHVWCRGSYQAWRVSVWANAYEDPDNAAGVAIPKVILDQLVMMRLAELVVDGMAVSVIDAMVRGSVLGNSGAIQLRGNLGIIKSALGELQEKCARVLPEI